MIFINKIHNFPDLLPQSVSTTIPPNAPSPTSHTDYCSDWYTKYNRAPYNTSTFFKGPLLYNNIMTENTRLDNIMTPNSFKSRIKAYLFEVQSSGDCEEWDYTNFKLTNVPGLRSSARINTKQNNNAL